jgi:hypothetical protein
MSGIKAARRIIFVKEVTAGTRVGLGTALWRGEGEFEDKRVVVFPPEDIGYVSGVDRNYIPQLLAGVTLSPTPVTFEQAPYLLSMCCKNVVTGVADGGGSGKIYAHPFPTTAPTSNVLQPYSVQIGDDNEKLDGAYVYGEGMVLEGKIRESWMMSASLACRTLDRNSYTASTIAFTSTGKHITDSANGLSGWAVGDKIVITGTANNNGTFTVASVVNAGDITVTEAVTTEGAGNSVTLKADFTTVALPSVEEILFGNTKLYIDEVAGTIGTTEKAGTLLSAKLNIVPGWVARWGASGQLYFTRITHTGKMEITLDLTFEFDGTANTEVRAWINKTARQIRLQANGSALATAGTKYSTKALRIDVAGKWEKLSGPLTDDDGNDTISGTFRVRYNSTAALFCNVEICNTLASLP